MTNATVRELRTKNEAAWANLTHQLQGMEPHLERSDLPGEWTTREVLSHLLGTEGWDLVGTLRSFARTDSPTVEFQSGDAAMTPARREMTLRQLLDRRDIQRRAVFGYLEGVPEPDLAARKVRIPSFKQFMGTDEISLTMFTGAMLGFHWNIHAGQLAKIRKAVGLRDAH